MEHMYYISVRTFCQARKGAKMKIHIKLPGGAEIDIERQPLTPYQFYTLCWTVCLAIVIPAFFAIWK